MGVLRSARSSSGESLVDVAQLQEFGGPPVIIPITLKMRRFLAVLRRRAGIATTGGGGLGVIVTQVPARPFRRPAFEKFRAGAGRRLIDRIAEQLWVR